LSYQAASTGRADEGADALGFHLNHHPLLAGANQPMPTMQACDAMTCGDAREC
jgi:hypothetical protein